MEVKMKKYFMIFTLLLVVSGITFHTGCKKSTTITDYPLQGVKWILESIQYSNQNIVPIKRLFYMLFSEDLSFQMQVDCNHCSGMYVLGSGNSILFWHQMTCTEAYCGDDSKDDEFHAALNNSSKYDINDNRLRIYFDNEQSHLNFIAESSTL